MAVWRLRKARRTVALHAIHAGVERLGWMDRASDVSTTLGLCAVSRKRWHAEVAVRLRLACCEHKTLHEFRYRL